MADSSTFKTGVESGVTTFKLLTSIPIFRGENDERHSHFRPYWRSWLQTIPVLYAREPFDAQHDVPNFTLPDRTSFKKPKSKATLARDSMRMQRFRENKDSCSALPFFEQMKEATTIQWDTQPFVLKSKLQSATKVIKSLKISLHCLRTSNNLLDEEKRTS